MQQVDLWHDSIEEAVKACVDALGGPKAAGLALWPQMNPVDAGRKLNHCLDSERAEKLELAQLVMILKRAREVDCHVGMAFLAEELGYQRPEPKDPETEREKLMREYISMAKRMERLGQQISKEGTVVQLRDSA